MEELDISVESFIETVKKTLPNELKFIRENNWAEIDTLTGRIDMHGLHYLLTERSVKNALRLHNLATSAGAMTNKEVKKYLKLLTSFFSLYEERYDSYAGAQDFTKMLEGLKDSKGSMKAEIEFQSDITKNITTLRDTIQKIKRADDKSIIQIPVFQDIPIPLAMRQAVEVRYPEVKIVVEDKINKAKGITNEE